MRAYKKMTIIATLIAIIALLVAIVLHYRI